jgi:hypothetical protein
MNPAQQINPVIYPMLICLSGVVVAMVLLGIAVVSVMSAIRRRRAAAMQVWRARGLAFTLRPAQASFLNESRSFGVGSNGTLALTAEAVYFAQVMPEREIEIPLREIAGVHLAATFNGRRGGGPYLVLRHVDGRLTGFQISEARKWADAIEKSTGGASGSGSARLAAA